MMVSFDAPPRPEGANGKVDALRARGQLGLARVRLLEQLDAATAAGPALVLAPAGFGKTTLLGQYARRHAGPAAAYQADAMEAEQGDTAARIIEAMEDRVRSASALHRWPVFRQFFSGD
jgi:ATP/maltotriose-dependent transcriptional regulator MalT